jgi:predicted nucleic acid-binding protein
LNVLVDTSVWSLSLRRNPRDLNPVERSIVVELTELIAEGRARLMGLVRQELLSGVRNSPQFEMLRTVLRAFPDVDVETSDYELAARASNQCKSKGVTVSLVDALICAVANARGWTIFTTDQDFENHAGILPVKLYTMRR